MGYGQAFIDDAKNGICEVKGSDLEAPVHIFMAHTDTVSLMRQRFRLLWKTADQGTLGVGYYTTNVCAILMTLKYLSEKKIVAKTNHGFCLEFL